MPAITERTERRRAGRRTDWLQRLGWFAALYVAGLAVVGAIALLLRAWLG